MEQTSQQVVGTMTDYAPAFTQQVKAAGQQLEEGAKQAAATIKVRGKGSAGFRYGILVAKKCTVF
jgi:hypothetical protein